MLELKLYNPETGQTVVYTQKRISFGEVKKVLRYNKEIQKDDARRKILDSKIARGEILSAKEEKEYVDLAGNEDKQFDGLVEVVVQLFDDKNVTHKAIEDGLDGNGLQVLQGILTDVLGGVENKNSTVKK